MNNYEIWDEKLDNFISNTFKNFLTNISEHNKEFILVYGEKNSGKQSLIDYGFNHFLNEREVQLITFESSELRVNTYPFKPEEKIKFAEIFPDLSLSGAAPSLVLSLTKTVKSLLQQFNESVLYIKNATKENTQLSLSSIKKMANSIPGSVVIIITTDDKELFEEFSKEPMNSFEIPQMNYANILEFKYFKSPYAPSSLLEKLAGSDQSYTKNIINLGNGNYGDIKLLLDEDINSFVSALDKNNRVKSDENSEEENNKAKLILATFLVQELLSEEALEDIFCDSEFDYITEIEKWLSQQILDSNGQFNTLLSNSKDAYISQFYNKRARREIALKLEKYIKINYPENYQLRSQILKDIDKRKSDTYQIIHDIRTNNVLHNNPSPFLTFIMNSENNEHDYLEFNTSVLNLHENAEFQIHFFNCLTNVQNRNYELITLVILDLLQIYYKLVEVKEVELAIRVGLVVSTAIINYNVDNKTEEANDIFIQVSNLIQDKLVQGNRYYMSYSVLAKILSGCFKSYQEVYYILYSLIRDLQSEPYQLSNLNTDGLISVAFSNLLGISFYLGDKKTKFIQDFYNQNSELIENNTLIVNKKYKLQSNLKLMELFSNEQPTKAYFSELSSQFLELKSESPSPSFCINYAGILFYNGELDKAKEILEPYFSPEYGGALESDDFYAFYCTYNMCLIKLKKGEGISDMKQYIIDLKVPSLFTDNPTREKMRNRIDLLQSFLLNSSQYAKWEDIEKKVLEEFRGNEGIFSQIWSFTDLQYWNDMIQ